MNRTMMRNGKLCQLNEDGLNAVSDYENHGGCCCCITIPPCTSCTHEGHPIAVELTDEFWEPVPVKRKGINLFDFLGRIEL